MDLRQRLYPMGFRPIRYGPPIFSEANLDPHYRPFRGIVWSIVVHAFIVTGLVAIPAYSVTSGRDELRDQAVIVDIDELRDVLYLPVLGGGNTPQSPKPSSNASSKQKAAQGKAGLSYPGPQPILSEFPNPTNHTQTVLQPALINPVTLELPLTLPNIVRLAPPPVESKLKMPDAVEPQARPASAVPVPLETAMTSPARPLAAPIAEPRFKVTDTVNPIARVAAPVSVTPDIPLSAPARPLAAPIAEPRFKVTDTVNPIARASAPVSVTPDIPLSAPARPLAAPIAEPKFRVTDSVNPIARPALTLPAAPTIALAGPARPLAAPRVEQKLDVPDSTAPAKQIAAAPGVPLPATLTGPAQPLAAPLAESKMKVPDAVAPAARTSAAPATASLNLPTSGPARPLAAPVIDSKLKVPDAVAPAARVPMASPIPVASMANPDTPLSPPPPKPSDSAQNLLVLSPTPARRDQPAVIPPGEARGQFAISPQPNLSFPGTEPGTKAGAGGSTTGDAASTGKPVAALGNNPSANTTNSGVSPASTSAGSSSSGSRPGPSSDVFPGITILGGVDDSRSPNSAAGNSRKGPPEPLQTSYGITILSSGGTGGGLPDFGVFGARDQVQTVYLDMRRTILDDPISWTAEYGISQATVTPTNERLTVVGSQAEILLPFPILKERPAIPAELARKNPDRMVIAYAVISTSGTMEQVSIKQSPDPLLNEIVLDALRKWTFRPARRNGEVVPAKFLVGIPLRAQ